ncbi:MAG: hypothetical protein RR843_00570, partial [Clostridia bacterium]
LSFFGATERQETASFEAIHRKTHLTRPGRQPVETAHWGGRGKPKKGELAYGKTELHGAGYCDFCVGSINYSADN